MQANQYNKLMTLLATARENAEHLQDDMKVLTLHGGEDACADAAIVGNEVGGIEKDLDKALDLLREIGAEKLKNTPTKED